MAEALGEMGAKLAITARKADELAQAKAHLQALGIEVVTFTNDLQKFDAIPGLMTMYWPSWAPSTFWSTTPGPPGVPKPRITRTRHGTR